MDYFEVFGLPRILGIDLAGLERKFHELSWKYHPDHHTAAPEDERKQALQLTALLNDAYRTLRNPLRRVEYLLGIEGFKPDGSKVSKAMLIEVFEINEQLAEAKSGGVPLEQIDSLRAQIKAKADQFDAELLKASVEWDELVNSGAPGATRKEQLAKLTEILSESSYIRNLERELEES